MSLATTHPGFRLAVITALTIGTVPMLAVPPMRWLGFVLVGMAGLGALVQWLWRHSAFGRHMTLLVAVLLLLGVVPVSTNVSYGHITIMGILLIVTVLAPYLITRRYFHEPIISFPIRLERRWKQREIGYIIFAGVTAYLLIPAYLQHTGSYLNWDVSLNPSHIARLFLGTNALGIWDEMFFVGICLALLRQHMPFIWANIVQATLWTSFLYELGFRGWGPIPIFIFALTQGYIFRKSKSLLYIVTVHLVVDFILFLALVHLHHPEYLRIFITI